MPTNQLGELSIRLYSTTVKTTTIPYLADPQPRLKPRFSGPELILSFIWTAISGNILLP